MPAKKQDVQQEEIREETANLIEFMKNLIDAGMSIDNVLMYGFEWAGNVNLGTDKYDKAALELKAAADALKISKRYQDATSNQQVKS